MDLLESLGCNAGQIHVKPIEPQGLQPGWILSSGRSVELDLSAELTIDQKDRIDQSTNLWQVEYASSSELQAEKQLIAKAEVQVIDPV